MGSQANEVRGEKIDWRTGKPMVEHGAAFWLEHERRRVEQGLSIPQYCAAQGLAISTYRHRVSGKKRGAAARPAAVPTSSTPSFVADTRAESAPTSTVEVVVQGMTVRLAPDGHPNSPTRGHLKFPHPDGASMRR